MEGKTQLSGAGDRYRRRRPGLPTGVGSSAWFEISWLAGSGFPRQSFRPDTCRWPLVRKIGYALFQPGVVDRRGYRLGLVVKTCSTRSSCRPSSHCPSCLCARFGFSLRFITSAQLPGRLLFSDQGCAGNACCSAYGYGRGQPVHKIPMTPMMMAALRATAVVGTGRRNMVSPVTNAK